MKSNTELHSRSGNGTGHAREYRIAESLLKVVGQVYLELGGDAMDR
jgi:hypothetical protein